MHMSCPKAGISFLRKIMLLNEVVRKEVDGGG